MDKAVAEKLKAEYPTDDLHSITSAEDGIEIVVRPASPAVMLKYESMKGEIGDPVKRVQANEFLVLQSMVYPDKDKFREELERRHLTGFWSVAAPEVRTITGARDSVRVSKL
jgi:hypothetical protein